MVFYDGEESTDVLPALLVHEGISVAKEIAIASTEVQTFYV